MVSFYSAGPLFLVCRRLLDWFFMMVILPQLPRDLCAMIESHEQPREVCLLVVEGPN